MNSSGFEKDCPCGTGTAQCWDMLPEILPAWDRDCTVLGHAMRDPACVGQGLHSVGTCFHCSRDPACVGQGVRSVRTQLKAE